MPLIRLRATLNRPALRGFIVKALKGAIDHWWLSNSMYLRPGVTKVDVFAQMPAGERARIGIAHFRGFANMLADRARDNMKTAEHALANPNVWGKGTDEIVQRFQRLSLEDRKASTKASALAARVEAEGLPDEVATYVPA